jgi:GMP synthase (glutamine-hydrolysing)
VGVEGYISVMTRILVVDNGGQWTHREWRTLRDLNVDAAIIPNTTPYQRIMEEGVDGLVLSGGAPRIGLDGDLGNCNEYLEKASFPILGICAGHQYMARYYGGLVKPSKTPEYGKVELLVVEPDSPLFKGVPSRSIVWESHNDEVVVLPDDFMLLAESVNCKVQAMQHKTRPLYGLQFHPEVEHTEYGEVIFKNFIEMCR